MTAALVGALERRVASDGARPLITWYDLDRDDRVELSARTFANWVDKTVNLMASIGADESPAVALPLLLTHPGHWVGLVWSMAAWQIGGSVLALPREHLKVVDLAVVGPDNTHPVPGVETVACSLHPLGLPFAEPPAAVTDYAEVLTQPDVHWTSSASAARLAFRGESDTSRRPACEVDRASTSSARHLVCIGPDADPWAMLSLTLLAPVLGGGSVVIVTGDADQQRIESIARTEQAVGASDVPRRESALDPGAVAERSA